MRYAAMPSEMICNARTCGGYRYLEEQDEQDDPTASLTEFLANCQHAKCKVVRLVRQQISKLQNVQYERFLAARDEAYEKMRNETPAPPEIHETLDNKVHVVTAKYGEVHEPYYDDLQEAEGEVHEPHDDLQDGVESEVEQTFNESHDQLYEARKVVAVSRQNVVATNAVESAATASLRCAASPGRAVDRKWMLRILDRVRHRAHLILAAVAVGVIVWTALVYGVFLGATACGSGRTCFRSSLKYTHAKRTLF